MQRAVERGSARLLGQEPATQASSHPGSPVVAPGPGGSGAVPPVVAPPGQGVGSDKRGGPSERLPADARGRLPGVDHPLPALPPLPPLAPVTLPEVREPLLPVQPPHVAPLDEVLPGGRPQR